MSDLLLGGLTPDRFMAEHWQKCPLFVAGAVPEAPHVIDTETLLDLATHPDAQSRRIRQTAGSWTCDQGPFRPRQLSGRGPWTVLVQGINLFLPEADALLRRFGFVPFARLDDLMASYATTGGGVGPHVDSYDVFLIQAAGTRRWEISGQVDRSLIPGLPLRILADFRPEQTFDCQPGDLLYLPPGYAHHGVALDEPCITLSVGFRAPALAELQQAFLVWLAEHRAEDGATVSQPPALYSDPDQPATVTPAQLPPAMCEQVGAALTAIRWGAEEVRDFLGETLSDPKPHVYFEPPVPALSRAGFVRALKTSGVALDLQTQMLYADGRVWCNGQLLAETAEPALRLLADRRWLRADDALTDPVIDDLYAMYMRGHLHPAIAAKRP